MSTTQAAATRPMGFVTGSASGRRLQPRERLERAAPAPRPPGIIYFRIRSIYFRTSINAARISLASRALT
jgi:hypothetical protein